MKIFISILFILLSSFVKCIVDSKIDKDFFYRRSKCDICNKNLSFIDLIPCLSYLILKGNCRYCKNKIHLSIFLYEISGFLVAIFYYLSSDIFYFFNILDYFIILLILFISIEDLYTYEINTKLQIILLFLVVINNITMFNFEKMFSILLLVIIYNLVYLLLHKGMGYGDIKFFSILSINLTFLEGINLFLYTFIYAGFVAILLLVLKKVNRKTKLALAPYISMAYITVLIIREYLIW